MARAADVVTLVAAALFLGTVVSWLAWAASRASDAVDDRASADEPQLSRWVPMVVTALFAVAVAALVVLTALVPAAA